MMRLIDHILQARCGISNRAPVSIFRDFTNLLLIVSTTACVTWNQKETRDISQAESGAAVVGQVGASQAVVSRQPRQHWVNLRKSKQVIPQIKAALATGQADDAETLARAYLALHPGDADGFSMLSAALALSGKYELASYYAEEAYKLRPSRSRLLNIKGLALAHGAHRSIEDYRLALSHFQEAFDADGKEVAAGLNLGGLYLELGSPDQAALVFQKVSERCGRCFPALMGHGTSLARARKFKEAQEVFLATLKAYPSHPTALYNLALLEKEGFKNAPKAESYLFALLKNKDPRYAPVREKAQALLRSIKGEASSDDRTMIAEEADGEHTPKTKDERQNKSKTKSNSPSGVEVMDENDLLLSGAEAELP